MENTNMNTVEEQQATTQPEGNGEKTFTQEDVNRIVGERLAKEKAKNDVDFVKREQDLQQRELAMSAKELLADKGLPKDLADILKYSDEESLKSAVDRILKLKNEELDDYKLIEVNRLPEGLPCDNDDNYSLEKAFRLNGKD